MAKTDWGSTDTVKPDDFNDIGREINQLRTDVDHIEVPAASLTEAGIVQLSNAKDSTSESQAATSKALKDVYDLAKSSLTLGNERKQEVVDALIALGVTASTSDSWDTLISKMSAIIKATGNATAADVLAGKTFSNANGNGLQGTMPNRGAGGTVTPGTTNQTKPAGYYSSPITVLGDPDLVPGNIRSGVDLFGVAGTLQPEFEASAYVDVSIDEFPPGRHEFIKDIITFPKGTKWFLFDSDGYYDTRLTRVIDADGDYRFFSTMQLTIGSKRYWVADSQDVRFPDNRYEGYESYAILYTYYVYGVPMSVCSLSSHNNVGNTASYNIENVRLGDDMKLSLLIQNAKEGHPGFVGSRIAAVKGTIYYGG